MRHLLLILMIALLPLRGWASESMAVSMAMQQLVVAQNHAAGDTGMPADCPLFGQISEKSAPEASSGSSSPLCNGCTTCQLCMALVTGYPPMLGAAIELPQAQRLTISASFASAERAPGFKPPIS